MWNDSEFNSTFASPGGAAGKDNKKNQLRSILPVTAETVNLATQVEGENSVFEYNHLRFHNICLIGIIKSVIKRSNDVTYILDDMTSADVTVKLQSDESEDMENDENMVSAQAQFIENQYVRVYGIVKSLQGQKYVQAFKILPINELNEITYHILNCMNTSISLASKSNCDASNDHQSVPSISNPLKNVNLNGNQEKTTGGLSGICMQISNVIKQSKTHEGLHIRDICAYFQNLSEAKVRETLDFLSTEGHVYSTIDDEHFKSTETL